VVKQERLLYWLIASILIAVAGVGVIVDGPSTTFDGLIDLQAHPARLINDFTAVAGDGAALLNAVLVASIGLLLVRINGVALSGPTLAAIFTMLGFGLFGKTPLNILPIIAGVWISARIAGKQFREYILIGLFGTALGPLVSLLAVELPIPAAAAIPIGALAGMLVGILLPAVAIVMLRLHQGFNLYNIGLTTGFLALFAAAVITGRGPELQNHLLWNSEPSLVLRLLIPILSGVLLLVGLVSGGVEAWKSYLRILKLPGRLPSDFMDMESPAGALVNMGMLGLGVWLYTLLVGADLSGPVLGGILTVIGFAAFGKHLYNASPVVVGVVLGALAFGMNLGAPGVILAALFGTTLAPLAGEFGIVMGIVAGFLHLAIVSRSGAWHIGIGLYNNGLAGGLTATLLVSVIEWYRTNRRTRKAAADLSSSSRKRNE
jgi:hypothetical protein